MTEHFKQLYEFVNMYGSRCTQGTIHYKEGGEPIAILGQLPPDGKVRPDMALKKMTQADVLEHARSQPVKLPGIESTLAQFRSFDPSTQSLLGLLFPDGEILTFVLAVQPVAR